MACQPTITNDIETVDYLFRLDEFEIEIGVYGCMGGRTDKFTMEKTENGHLFYSKKHAFKKLINRIETDSLKQFLNGLTQMDTTSLELCTGTTVFRAKSFSKGVEFVDNDCNEKWELLQRILDFQEVWRLEN